MLCCVLLPSLGCVQVVRTQVNAFHSSDTTLAVGSIAVQALQPEKANTLEFAHYRRLLEPKLEQLGYQLVDSSQAAYVAYLDYAVVESELSDSKVDFYASRGFSRFGERSNGVLVERSSRSEYVRKLVLVIARNEDDGQRLYEVTGLSRGQCGIMSVVYDEMLQALLQAFPYANGSVQTISVSGETRC